MLVPCQTTPGQQAYKDRHAIVNIAYNYHSIFLKTEFEQKWAIENGVVT